MKRLAILSIFLMILSILASGCAKEAPMHPDEAKQQAEDAAKTMPDIGEATPELETEPTGTEKPAAETEKPTAPEATLPTTEPKLTPEQKVTEITSEPKLPEQELGTLGSRYDGEEPATENDKIPNLEDQVVVKLLGDTKTMDQGNMTVKIGTTVTYKNTDDWPHTLSVETGKDYDTVRHAKQRLEAGEVWSYKFTEPGVFLVRDLFSGTMRQTVNVK